MIKKIQILLLGIIVFGCGTSENDKENLNEKIKKEIVKKEHLNILISPDLSNRIEGDKYPKPISDVDLVTSIYNNYYSKFYKINNRNIGQKDEISFLFTNPSIISQFNIDKEKLHINLANKNNSQRIKYLKDGDFQKDILVVDEQIKEIYDKALEAKTGGDIYNYLKKQINNISLKFDEKEEEFEGVIYQQINRNIIILLTDGYIEAGLYGKSNCVGKKCYFLSQKRVNDFRKAFKKSGESDMKMFFEKEGYGIIPVENKNLKNVEIIVAEIYDRSLNRKTGSQTIVPNDYDILQLFWADWLEKSGVKRYKLLPTANSGEEFVDNIRQFISNK